MDVNISGYLNWLLEFGQVWCYVRACSNFNVYIRWRCTRTAWDISNMCASNPMPGAKFKISEDWCSTPEFHNVDNLAEWFKDLASGANSPGRGFEPHICNLPIVATLFRSSGRSAAFIIFGLCLACNIVVWSHFICAYGLTWRFQGIHKPRVVSSAMWSDVTNV